MPGYYGLSPYSFLLRNNQGKGLEIAWKERYGMVTDAQWTDVNKDGRKDLIIVGDYMPVTILENTKEGFKEKQKEYGIGDISGFWNCIETTDLNGDNIPDFIVGNAGLNHKWTASKENPIHLYLGDFDGNSNIEPLLFYRYINRYIPFASLDKLKGQLPMLKKKFNTYESFKKVSKIEDLIPDYKEKLLEYKSVNELRSVIFLSEKGKYIAKPLDMVNQLSDINDILVDDQKNVYYIGNRKNYVAELGPVLANSGAKLSGFDKASSTFKKFEKLPIPNNLNTRKLARLENGKFVVVSNEGQSLVFEQ